MQVLSECLYTIPANDPASIALEPTLQELISDGLQLSKLPGYQERLGVDQDAKLCLQGFFKSILSGLKGRSRADQSWLEDEEGERILREGQLCANLDRGHYVSINVTCSYDSRYSSDSKAARKACL